jgi:hypothetical protein
MATYPPFVNGVRISSTAPTVKVNVAGQPGDDLAGYRIAGYKGASPNWVLAGVYVIPSGTIIPASGVKTISPTFSAGSPAVIGIAAPNVDPNSTAGLGNLVQMFAASLTVSEGPFVGVTPTYIGSDVSSTGTSYAALAGTGSTADYSTFAWTKVTGQMPADLPNAGQTLTISDPPADPEDPEDPDEASPLAAAVLAFLGQTGNTVLQPQVEEHVSVIREMAKSYTRGNGFTDDVPVTPIGKVIVSAAARLVANPEQMEATIGTVTMRSYFTGWSLAERFVLNGYRSVAQ